MKPCNACGLEMKRHTEQALLREFRTKMMERAGLEFRMDNDAVAFFLRDIVVKDYVRTMEDHSVNYHRTYTAQTPHTCEDTTGDHYVRRG
jgi:hypothetical protein